MLLKEFENFLFFSSLQINIFLFFVLFSYDDRPKEPNPHSKAEPNTPTTNFFPFYIFPFKIFPFFLFVFALKFFSSLIEFFIHAIKKI